MTIKIKVPPKFTVQEDGVSLSSDIDTLNFSTGVLVTTDAYGKATITTSFGGGTGIAIKAGVVASGSFSGNPKKATITFTTSFASAAYAITITGVDTRSWSYESKTSAGFTINTNANAPLTSEVSWQAITSGEF